MPDRDLTYDERKAAEAAFRGLPVDPKWSKSAHGVYQGIIGAMHGKPGLEDPSKGLLDLPEVDLPEGGGKEADLATLQEAVFRTRRDPDEAVLSEGEDKASQRLMNRQEAIEAGILVDVSPIAETVGLRLSVGISRPLWELGISASSQLAEDECRGRVRDVLLALRLYIEQHEVKGPWIKFTALLSLPPDAAPQICSLIAIAHRDPTAPHSLTLMLPEETSGISVSE
jgi:hypothetical protein